VAPWVATMVRNLIRDAARRRGVRRLEPLHRDRDDIVVEPVDTAPDPEERAHRHQLQRLVWRSPADLDESQREIIVLRNIVGVEIPEYTKMMAEAREQALDRMVEDAESLGANAVIETRYMTSMLMAGATELLVFGTAVVLEDAAPTSG